MFGASYCFDLQTWDNRDVVDHEPILIVSYHYNRKALLLAGFAEYAMAI